MRLSTKGRFAVTAMIDIALRENSGPVPLSDIGARHQISMSYLEQIFSKLRQHGLVQSTRGPGGGYALGQRADSLTVAAIVRAIEDDGEPANTTAARQDPRAVPDPASDVTQALWDAVNSRMLDYLESITLRSLAIEQRSRGSLQDEPPVVNRGVFKRPQAEAVRAGVPNSVFALGKALLAGQA